MFDPPSAARMDVASLSGGIAGSAVYLYHAQGIKYLLGSIMSMIGGALGNLRRTHHASQLSPSLDGESVTIMGWVAAVRSHGNISFATIRDSTGAIQVVAKKGACADDIREKISAIKPHSSVSVTGTAARSGRSPGGVEILPEEMRVFSEVVRTPPFEPATLSVKNIDTRLDVRCIDLRREPLRHVFRARTQVLRSIREYFAEQNFTEISTPKVIASATEGGAALFPIFYYDKEAFLAHLWLSEETCTPSLLTAGAWL